MTHPEDRKEPMSQTFITKTGQLHIAMVEFSEPTEKFKYPTTWLKTMNSRGKMISNRPCRDAGDVLDFLERQIEAFKSMLIDADA